MYGKKLFQGMAARIMTEVPILDKLIGRYEESSSKNENVVSYNDQKYCLREAFVKSYNFSEDLNLWGKGPLVMDNYDDLVSLSTRNKEPLSAAMLSCWTVGEQRVIEKCMGNDTKLSCLKSKSRQLQHETEIAMIKETSHDFKKL